MEKAFGADIRPYDQVSWADGGSGSRGFWKNEPLRYCKFYNIELLALYYIIF